MKFLFLKSFKILHYQRSQSKVNLKDFCFLFIGFVYYAKHTLNMSKPSPHNATNQTVVDLSTFMYTAACIST